MKRLFVYCLMALSMWAVAAPVAQAESTIEAVCSMDPNKAVWVLNQAAAPMSAIAGYTITSGDLIDAYFASEATITDAGLTSDYEQIWEVKYGGITLCVIENI
ncbi:MAG: hypothetical protein U0176_00345 [Bacteroidia bacterium]